MKHKYPIGTKIIFNPISHPDWQARRSWDDRGKSGIVIGIDGNNRAIINLPTSKHNNIMPLNGSFVTWRTEWCNLKKDIFVGEQLVFTFME